MQRQPGDALLRSDIADLDDLIGDVSIALGDQSAALEHYRASLAIRRELVAEAPKAPLAQRALAVVLSKLARIPGGGVTWSDVAGQFEAMDRLGLLAQRDAWALFRRRASGQSTVAPSP